MAGLGGMNVGNAFSGVPQNAGTTQQGSTLQSLPGMGTSTAQQTQQSVAQTPSTLGYAPQQNAQNVFGYNMGRLASAMDPSATLPFYNQYDYRQPQQNINPYQGVTDILGSLGSFFNESIAPTFQSAYDQQFQNFQNQLNEMSQRFAPTPPPPASPSVNYMSEIDALRQQIAQLQGQIANPVIPTPAPTPAPAATPTPAPAAAPSTAPISRADARALANVPDSASAQRAANILNQPVIRPNGQVVYPIGFSRAQTSAPTSAPAATPSQVAQQFAIPVSQNIAPSPAASSGSISLSPTPAPRPAPAPTPSAASYLSGIYGAAAPTPAPVSSGASYLSGLFNQPASAPVQQASNIRLGGGYSNIRLAGGGEIPAFDSSLNSGAQSNLMSSAERVYDLGPGYRELGVIPGNIAGGTAGPNVPYVAPPGLTPPPATSTTTSATPIKYSQALSEYQKLGLGQQGIFALATTPQQLADALKKPVIQKGKTYTPKTTGAAHGGMVHGGMTNRLKHMLK